MAELTDKQKRFCEEYLIDLNATQAAIRAGYSEKTAAVQGAQNLIKLNVQGYLEQLKAERSTRTNINQDYVLNKLKKYADANVVDFFNFKTDGSFTIKKLDDLPRELTDCVVEISKTRDGYRLKIADKLNALEDLARHLGIFDGTGKDTDENEEGIEFEGW